METNGRIIQFMVDHIEQHLSETLSVQDLANATGYSPYHLHHLFRQLTGIPIHQYIKRRKLTEAAKRLACSGDSILGIALEAGYESQQAFSIAFKRMYRHPPHRYRNMHQHLHLPQQLKFEWHDTSPTGREGSNMEITLVDRPAQSFVGFRSGTRPGFFVIPRLWQKLRKKRKEIHNQLEDGFLVAINDYSEELSTQDQPDFSYCAAVAVNGPEALAPDMCAITLPAGRFAVFAFSGKAQESIQPTMDYIYKQWLPESSCVLNEQARLDLVRYGEQTDATGNSRIEVWIPIID